MREDEKLRARLAQLQSTATSTTTERGRAGDVALAAKSLEQRLQDLSGGKKSSRDQREFHSRLAALTTEDYGGVTCEELAARFSRLGEGSGVEVGSTGSAFDVPEDVSGDFQDLDDLLADALQGDDHDTHGVTQKAPLNLDSPQLNQTLDGLEAAATAEIAKNASGAAAISEEAGLEADALEAFLQGGSRRDRREGGVEVAATGRRPVKEPFGDDEERLLQMMTDQVRLEGHGIITSHETKPSKEKGDELWLPLAPTTKPVMSPSAGGIVTSGPGQNNDAAARLIAQQAMDEARLGLSTTGESGSRGSGEGEDARRNHEAGKVANSGSDGDSEESELWCCLCSGDAVLRCRQCEEENGGDGLELFCSKCSKEIHRGDPAMRSHRPHAVSRRGGTGRIRGSTMEAFKQGLKDWKR